MRIPFDKYYFMPLPDGSGYDHYDRTNKVCIDFLIGSWLAARLCDDDTGVEHLRMWCGSDCIIATRRGIDVRVIVEHHNYQNI